MENFLRTILSAIKELEQEPVVYGSFGLSLYLGQHKQEFGDLDILVDDYLLEGGWDNFKVNLIRQGFYLQDEKEHEFSLADKVVGFGKKSNLIRDGIIDDYSELIFSDVFGALTLSPESFLKAYMFSQKDGYRRDVRGKKDEETIEKIKNYIKKAEIYIGKQGDGATEVFSGENENSVVEKMYAESAPYFAEIIRKLLSPRLAPYEMLDAGTFRGELLDKIVSELGSEYSFHKIGVDLEKSALSDNEVVDDKVVGDIAELSIGDKAIDVVICRYVLQWNTLDRQKKILSELQRVCRGFGIIQHAGADSEDTDEWREKMHDMVFGGLPKVSRPEGYFSSSSEIERLMSELGIKFERVQNRKINNISSVFAEKYRLSENEIKDAQDILGDKDYIIQTTWIFGDTIFE